MNQNSVSTELIDASVKDQISEFKTLYPTVCEAFSTIQLEQLLLFSKKCTDYGIGNIAAGTQLKTQKDIEFALEGLWFRISDKVNRWKNIQFNNDGKTEVKGETLLDTFQDISNYAIIAQIVARGLWHEN